MADTLLVQASVTDNVTGSLKNIKNNMQGVAQASNQTGVAFLQLGTKAKGLAGPFDALNNTLKKFTGAAVLGGGTVLALSKITDAYKDAVIHAAKWQSSALAIETVEGSAAKASKTLDMLRQMASLPGLDLEPLQKGYLGFRSLNVSAIESVKTMKAFGNAIALAGGGSEQFASVNKQILQMLGKGRVLQEDITIIAESMPRIRTLMQEAFGTTSLEAIRNRGVDAQAFIRGIVAAAEKLPPAMDTIQNQMDNATTAWSRFKASFIDTDFVQSSMKNWVSLLDGMTEVLNKKFPTSKEEWIGGRGGMSVISNLIKQNIQSGRFDNPTDGPSMANAKIGDTKNGMIFTGTEWQSQALVAYEEEQAKKEADRKKLEDARKDAIAAEKKKWEEIQKNNSLETYLEKKRIEEYTKNREATNRTAWIYGQDSTDYMSLYPDQLEATKKDNNRFVEGRFKAYGKDEDSATPVSVNYLSDSELENTKHNWNSSRGEAQGQREGRLAAIEAENKALEKQSQLYDSLTGKIAGVTNGPLTDFYKHIGSANKDLASNFSALWSNIQDGFGDLMASILSELTQKAAIYGLLSILSGNGVGFAKKSLDGFSWFANGTGSGGVPYTTPAIFSEKRAEVIIPKGAQVVDAASLKGGSTYNITINNASEMAYDDFARIIKRYDRENSRG